MNNAFVVILVVGGLIILDLLALRFGFDSRDLIHPDSGRRTAPLHGEWRETQHVFERPPDSETRAA